MKLLFRKHKPKAKAAIIGKIEEEPILEFERRHWRPLVVSLSCFLLFLFILVPLILMAADRKYAAVDLEAGARSGNVTEVSDADASGGKAIVFLASSLSVLNAGTHNDSVLTYSGSWTNENDGTMYQSDDKYTNITGSTAVFKMSGTGFRVFGAKASHHGILGISIDGGQDIDADLYATSRQTAMVYERTGLSSGEHTVVLKYTGRKNAAATNTYILLDKVEVLSTTSTPSQPATCPAGQTGTPPNCVTLAPITPGTRPTAENTGPAAGTSFTDIAWSTVANGGTFTNCRVTVGAAYASANPITFRDCIINGYFGIHSATTLTLERVRVNGAVAWENTPKGLIKNSSILFPVGGDGKSNVALRPKTAAGFYSDMTTPTPLTVENSYIYSPKGRPDPDPNINQHIDAFQSGAGNGYIFRNTTFEIGGPYNGTQTASMSLWAANSLVEDCWFAGGENSAWDVYWSGPNNRIVRPKFAAASPSYYYNPSYGRPTITNPTDFSGNPVTLQASTP